MNNIVLSKLIINYLEFQKILAKMQNNEQMNVFLINKKELNEFLKVCKNYENKFNNESDLIRELCKLDNKNIKISNKNIKLISNFSEIEDEHLELVDKNFATALDYSQEELKNKEFTLIKKPEDIQIIFRHNYKSKLIIFQKTILQIIESPFTFNNDVNNNKGKNNYYNNNNENVVKKQDILNNSHTHSNSINSGNDKDNITIIKRKSVINNNDNIKAIVQAKDYYKKLYQLLNRQKEIIKSIKGPLNLGPKASYFILSKKYFHKLIKIFEPDNIYENEEHIIEISEMTDPNKLEKKEYNEISERYTKRILDMQNEKAFPVEFVQIDRYKFPKDFIFLENFFFEFFCDNIRNKYKYEMILGNNLLFIIDNKIVYVFSALEDNYSIEAIFNFEDKTKLKSEIESEFKNVENMSQYYKNKKLNLGIIKMPQMISDKNGNKIGDILIFKNQNNIDSNKVVDKSNNINDLQRNNNNISDKNTEENSIKIEVKHSDPQLLFHKYVEALFICMFKIENLRLNFQKKNNDMNSITSIIYNFMKNKEINLDDIKKIENKIKELKKDISELNFENLINFVLDKLHEELNNKKIINKENPKDDNDEKISYDNFKKYYFEQNDSIIQRTFFGVKETNILYNCCQLTKYSFEICKYLSFENINQKNDIQSLVDEWENSSIKDKQNCDMCLIDTDTSIQNKIYDCPEILIIIINNNKNIIKIDSNIKINKRSQYQLINFISDTKNENNDINVIYKEGDFWYVYQNNNIKKNNAVKDLNSYIPCVIFYGKINKSVNEKNTNLSYITAVFESSFESEIKNDVMNNMKNINQINNLNNQNNMFFPNSFYNFNQYNNNFYQNRNNI